MKKRPVRPSFLAFLEKFGFEKPLKCVEIGVFSGWNAAAMLDYAPNIHLTLVDPYIVFCNAPNEDVAAIIEEYAHLTLDEKYKGRITWIRDTSENASKQFGIEHFDYIYIDGDHTWNGVQTDIRCWLPKLKDRGVMGGHDVALVEKPVLDALKNTALHIFMVECYLPKQKFDFPMHTNIMDWWFHKEMYAYDPNGNYPRPKAI